MSNMLQIQKIFLYDVLVNNKVPLFKKFYDSLKFFYKASFSEKNICSNNYAFF